MKRSLQLLTSGIPGFNLFSSLESSSGRESKKVQSSPKHQRSALKERIIQRASEALMGRKELGKAQRALIIGLVTQALDSTTDDELLELLETACGEFDAILTEFGR